MDNSQENIVFDNEKKESQKKESRICWVLLFICLTGLALMAISYNTDMNLEMIAIGYLMFMGSFIATIAIGILSLRI